MARPEHPLDTARFARGLRRRMTPAEARIWLSIKAGQTGARFRRQVPIGRWVADFACLDPKIVIEVDDQSHEFRDETERTRYLEQLGFVILRFWNDEIRDEPEAVGGLIRDVVGRLKEGGGVEDLL